MPLIKQINLDNDGVVTSYDIAADATNVELQSPVTIDEQQYETAGDAIGAAAAAINNIEIDIADLGISKIGISQIGMPNGVASLGNDGKVSSSQLPEIPTKVSELQNDSGYITGYTETDPTVPAQAKASTKPSYTASEVGAVATAAVGSANGVAELDSNGKVPAAQLPSFVDEIIEGYLNPADGKFYEESTYETEILGEEGKIYTELATNKTYRQSGSAFVEISESIALGETSSTAYAGNKGKANADAIAAIKDGTNIDSFSDVETALGDYMKKGVDYVTAGQKDGTTLGTYATTEGRNSSAPGYAAHTEGSNSAASASCAHAEGSGTRASGQYSHAEGEQTVASGTCAHTEGHGTSAGRQSHAEGYETNAEEYSHSEGRGTNAGYTYSHAEGYYTQTNCDYQHVQGKYNEGKTNTAFEIGNGTSENARSNAFEVDQSGNVIAAGDITDGDGNILSDIATALNEKANVEKSYDYGDNQSTKTQLGFSNINGFYIQTDGTDIYYSNGLSNQYVLDKSTSTQNTKTWNRLTNFYGNDIQSDGTDIYYSSSSAYQFVLDKSTSTWSTKAWNGLLNFDGCDIQSDGTDIYYSMGSAQYVLNKSTSTWNTKTWSGYTNIDGRDIQSDGIDIYYSGDSDQYILNKATSTWNTKTWLGLSSFYGKHIWSDGTNIYCSDKDGYQYVLNKSTSTWNTKTWSGLTFFDNSCIWSDGTNIYYSEGDSNQYVLDKIANGGIIIEDSITIKPNGDTYDKNGNKFATMADIDNTITQVLHTPF